MMVGDERGMGISVKPSLALVVVAAVLHRLRGCCEEVEARRDWTLPIVNILCLGIG